ncbi:MAG: insulinase family protein [Zetaproteobacteria bacterium]|nr:insulinase family protein [Zetaproteobacteria bacterium]
MMRLIVLVCMALTIQTAQAVPMIQTATLNNGLRVLLIEAHNVPMVAMQLTLPAGSRFDAKHKAGSATMLAAMLSDHTAKHDQKAWADWLDFEALHLGVGASRDTLNISLTVVRASLPEGLDALSEALLQPGWDKKRFHQLQEDSIASAVKSQESPNVLAAQATASLLYGQSGYGHMTSGTAKSLKNIRLKDLKSLYQHQIKPLGSVLAVSGDIRMNELLPMLNQRLSTWKGKPKHAALFVSPIHAEKVQTTYVALPTSQALVQFSRIGIARSDKHFFPLFVMNHYLGGGGFGSKLMEEVREKRGLVYGVYSYFIPLAGQGPFVITLQTRASQADKAATVVRDVMKSMVAGDIDPKRLQATKDNLTGGFAQRMDSNRERVGLMAMIGFYQMPLNYLQGWTEQVDSVTVADIKKMAKKYLQPNDWNMVQVGPVKE